MTTMPPPADLLTQAVDLIRRDLDPALPVSDRLRTIWAGAFAARDLGAGDVVETTFLALAKKCGLERDLGRTAEFDLKHIIRWAMLGRDPLGN